MNQEAIQQEPPQKKEAEGKGAGAASKKQLERRCIVSRNVKSPDEMIRFVLDPENVVTPDLSRKLPGRGYWVTADRETLHNAVNRGAFARSSKGVAKVPNDLFERTAALLKARCLDQIAVARRSGIAACGAENVRQRVVSRAAAAIILAQDAGKDAVSGVRALARSYEVDVHLTGLEADALGSRFGKPRTPCVSLQSGRLCKAILCDLNKWHRLIEPSNFMGEG